MICLHLEQFCIFGASLEADGAGLGMEVWISQSISRGENGICLLLGRSGEGEGVHRLVVESSFGAP